jgi:uncharacterized protein with HEPN domain
MPLNENDLSFLIDIVDCIMDINEFTKETGFHEFEKDKMRKLAVERQLEIIGQAANKISKETQNTIENIPWGNIIGLRNKLAHDYGEILAERIWSISKKSIQELMKELEKIEELKDYINRRLNCYGKTPNIE